MQRRLITLLLILVVSGCALLRPAGSTPLPGGGYWQPLTPAQLGRQLSAVQKVDGHFGGHNAVLVFYIEVEGDHLALVGTLPDGTELFSLEQTATHLSVKASPLLPPQMQPQAVLADLQMVFWPAAAVQKNLAAAGLSVRERDDGTQRIRTIERGDEVLMAVHYAAGDPWRGTVQFEQRAWHYSYDVATIQLQE